MDLKNQCSKDVRSPQINIKAHENLVKIPTRFLFCFVDTDQDSNIYMERICLRIAKITFKMKNKVGGMRLADFKT